MLKIPIFFAGQSISGVYQPALVFNNPFPVANRPITRRCEITRFPTVKVDWKETRQAHIFKVDVPGMKKEQVKIVVQVGRILLIRGKMIRDIVKDEKSYVWHRMERSSGKFLRCFKLPRNAKMDQIKATMEDGLLIVTVPKMEERIIKISGGVQPDQNGAMRAKKSTANKGNKVVVKEAKDVKGIKISGESSRRHKNGVTEISDDAQENQNVVLRAKKSTADKGKAVVKEAKDVVPETVPEEKVKHVVGAVKLSGRKIKWE